MIRDILVNLSQGVEKDAACTFAASLATHFGAHLTAVSISYEIDVPPFYMGALPTDFIEAQLKENETAAHNAEMRFHKLMAERNLPHEIRTLGASLGLAAQQFTYMSRLFDVTVVSQPNPDRPGPEEVIAETVLLESGRAILVIPHAYEKPFSSSHVMLAWDGGRAAARALAEALPLLHQANTVDIIRIGAEEDEDPEAQEVIRHLARHKLKTEVRCLPLAAGQSVSTVLLDEVRARGADLLVMGGYGHSRLKEMVMGGVTREIFATMTVPVLMAH
ncbi:universal stress protein [Xanthobacter sp. TB0136]|uniref:universal stress protein n=1 Tax=Xanthobacter sp. TB0136 TaxID=3459177 RepID=UPI00403959D1